MFRKTYLGLLIALALSLGANRALADIEPDPAYAFGTTLVMTSPRQLADPNKTWWGDMLPMEYRFSIGSIVDVVNKARAARGVETMIDVTTYPINVGGEFAVEGGYEYTVDFQKMTPEDVEIVLAAFPLTGVFSDLKRELRPVRVGYFWGNSLDGSTVSIALPDGAFVVSQDESFSAVKARLTERFAVLFAGRAKFDLGINRYSSVASGMDSFDVNLTVYLDGAEKIQGYPVPLDSERDV